MNKGTLLLVLSIFSFGLAQSQEKMAKTLLEQDLDVLKLNLETYHTGLFTYSNKKQLDDWFEQAKSTIEDATPQEFFRKINELNLLIKNGHTTFHLNPAQREKDLKMPPFGIYKFKDSFYVTSVKPDAYQNIVGKQLLSINSVPINEVFNSLLKYKKRDGNNTTQPSEELLQSFTNIYALDNGTADSTTVKVGNSTGPTVITLPNIPFQITESATDNRYERGGVSSKIMDNVAFLEVPTFYGKPLKKEKYKSKLKAFFKKVQDQKIEHLIIDVRNNGGGNTETVEELISYIHDQKFTFYQDVYQLHKKWDTSIIPPVNHIPDGADGWTLKKGNDGFYRAISGTSGMNQVSPKKSVFKGKLYVLINGNSLSAAAEFASFIKEYREATFIGEEAGGNRVQNTSGIALQIGLPNSNVIAEVPIILWKMNVKIRNEGHGVKPDYWVRNSIEDEMNNKDSVKSFTYELIEKSISNNGE